MCMPCDLHNASLMQHHSYCANHAMMLCMLCRWRDPCDCQGWQALLIVEHSQLGLSCNPGSADTQNNTPISTRTISRLVQPCILNLVPQQALAMHKLLQLIVGSLSQLHEKQCMTAYTSFILLHCSIMRQQRMMGMLPSICKRAHVILHCSIARQ